MIIADTNVVSEFMRDAPDPTVLAWAQKLNPAALSICVVTVEKIERGLGRLPQGKRRRDLKARWKAHLDAFAETVEAYDLPAAQATARVLVQAESSGRPISHANAQIAGVCLAHGHDLATRNGRDFAQVCGLTVINPFAYLV
ncbi:MAG: type II toxin-antitoxin system VapC family toxin [Propionicimonas sp.]|uniref:type II toxin-antitoxin system VapC family toxin n=1 Tax=Propionicimonas sp. TaxID=1955623 RepID=UPI002B219C62|nr:type II toxin-antitoxin system VapC family toxin [Propionicimonas sp.]MEA4944781.1 type II toxin-antitoxin system VapC family toxin [Propionicimonas sp.]